MYVGLAVGVEGKGVDVCGCGCGVDGKLRQLSIILGFVIAGLNCS